MNLLIKSMQIYKEYSVNQQKNVSNLYLLDG